MTGLRFYPAGRIYLVAETEVPSDLRSEIARRFLVRFPAPLGSAAREPDRSVIQRPASKGRWDAHDATYSCDCGVDLCAHRQAVLEFLGGPATPEPGGTSAQAAA